MQVYLFTNDIKQHYIQLKRQEHSPSLHVERQQWGAGAAGGATAAAARCCPRRCCCCTPPLPMLLLPPPPMLLLPTPPMLLLPTPPMLLLPAPPMLLLPAPPMLLPVPPLLLLLLLPASPPLVMVGCGCGRSLVVIGHCWLTSRSVVVVGHRWSSVLVVVVVIAVVVVVVVVVAIVVDVVVAAVIVSRRGCGVIVVTAIVTLPVVGAARRCCHRFPGSSPHSPVVCSSASASALSARIVLEQVRRAYRCNTGHVDLQADACMAAIGLIKSQYDCAGAIRGVEVPMLDGLQEDAVVPAEHHEERRMCHCRRYHAVVGMAAHCRDLSHSFRHLSVRWKKLTYCAGGN